MTHHTAHATSEPAVRLSGGQGIVAAIPQLLGFVPTDSLVLVCLTGPRSRVGPVVRVDLFPPGSTDMVRQLTQHAVRYADSAVVVCYDDAGRPACLDPVLEALARGGVPVVSALCVGGGVIREAATARAMADDPGIPVLDQSDPQSQQLAAATVLAGRRVLATRAELAASIAGPEGPADDGFRTALADARDRFEAILAESPRDLTVPLSVALDEAFARVVSEDRSPSGVGPGAAADLIVLIGHIGCRDQLVARAVGRGDASAIPALISVARRCPRDCAAEICAVLAAAAYRSGDGALAQCAVDRTLESAPSHRLGNLLRAAFTAGIPPQSLAALSEIRIPADHRGPKKPTKSTQQRQRRAISRLS
jgi:hypothetical protein